MENHNLMIRLLLSIIMTFAAAAPATAELDFFRLFLKVQDARPLPMYSLLAHYSSEDGSLFLGMHEENKSYQMFELGKEVNLGSLILKVKTFQDDRLIFESVDGKVYFLSFLDKNSVNPEVISGPPKIKNLSSVSLGTYASIDSLSEFKAIATAIGIPKFITAQFTSLPKVGRTNAGRRGWVLDETIPKILLLASPFKRGDLIVTIDGQSTSDIEGLRQHLQRKSASDYFDVEIQRDEKLKMIRVRL